jgi:hypothetical protein
MTTTTRAMRELLERKGIAPTGDAKQDMALAKSVMPPSFKKEKLNEQS